MFILLTWATQTEKLLVGRLHQKPQLLWKDLVNLPGHQLGKGVLIRRSWRFWICEPRTKLFTATGKIYWFGHRFDHHWSRFSIKYFYCARDDFSVIANWHNSHECSCCLNFNWKGAGLSVSVIFSAEVSNLNCKSWAVRKKEDHDGHQLSGWEDVNDNTRKNLDVLWKRGSTGGGFGHSYIIGENVPGLNPMQTQQILFFLKTNARTTSPIDSYGGLALNWTEFFVCWRAHSEMTDSCRSIVWAWIDFGMLLLCVWCLASSMG